MKILDGLENVKQHLPYPVVTLGNFDGVHLGHQAIFRLLIDRAKKKEGTSVAFTFAPHPLRVIAPERAPRLLTTYKNKIQLIEDFGIDIVVCANFTKEFARLSAEDFVTTILCNVLGAKEVFIGANYRFGKGKKGNPDLLRSLGKKCGFKVTVLDEVQFNDTTISSSKIRALVAKGKMEEVSEFLGRHYSVEGIVIEGAKRGKSLLNTPTANLHTANELLPKDGVYAVTVELNGKTYGGATNIGINPTFKDKQFSIETNIFNFKGNLPGKDLKINFLKRIRDEIKFSGPQELAEQLKKDIALIKDVLKDQASLH